MTKLTFKKKLQDATEANDILSLLTQAAWHRDKREGKCPIPTLEDIASYEPVQIAWDKAGIDWNDIKDLLPREIRDILNLKGKIYEATYLIEPFDEASDALVSIDKRIREFNDKESETLQKQMDMQRLLSFFSFGVALISDLEDRIEALHLNWTDALVYAPKQTHPLTPVVRAWLEEKLAKKITQEYDNKHPVGIVSNQLSSIKDLSYDSRDLSFDSRESAQIPEFTTPESITQIGTLLPEQSYIPGIMHLDIAGKMDIAPKSKSGAVSHTLRLFFESLMSLEPHQTNSLISFTLQDLITYLYPNRKFHKSNQLKYIHKAVMELDRACVQYDGGFWRPVALRHAKGGFKERDHTIVLDVRLPVDARKGMLVEKQVLRELGAKPGGAAQFSAYMSACHVWDKHGTVQGKIIDPTKPVENRNTEGQLVDADGKPIYHPNGKPIKDHYHSDYIKIAEREDNPQRKKYPVLPNSDLIKMCGLEYWDNKRDALRKAKAHLDDLQKMGIIRIDKSQGGGWRIMPSERHVNLYRAVKKTQ